MIWISSTQRATSCLASLVVTVAFGLGWAGVASAKPAWAITNGNSCRDNCHVTVETGRMLVTGEDGFLDLGVQLDGKTRGSLRTFDVHPGSTVTLSMQVSNGDSKFAVQLKRLETGGQLVDLANLMTWLEDNLQDNVWTRQEVSNPPYFTKDDGNNGGLPASEAGVFHFDLFIDPATPPDVYDLEFAIAGMSSTEDLYYQDEHFYLQVLPEPGALASMFVAVATLALGTARTRKRLRTADRTRTVATSSGPARGAA